MRIEQYGIYWCYLPIVDNENHVMSGSKLRPCIVVSNDINNDYASTVEVVPLTKRERRLDLPVHVAIENDDSTVSTAMIENKRTIDKSAVKTFKRMLNDNERRETQIALLTQNGFIW